MTRKANTVAASDASLKECPKGILSQQGLTSDEYYAEVKRGYDDCVAGRTRPAEEVFREIEAKFGL